MEQATREPDDIRARFVAGDANYMVIPPKGSRLFVLDEDVPGALDALGDLPKTMVVMTSEKAPGLRGRHLYGLLPDGVGEDDVPYRWEGGEVRIHGNGGVVGPFSRHHTGSRYEPIDGLGVETPREQWVHALIASGERVRQRATAQTPSDAGWLVSEGHRHPFLASKAGSLRRIGLDGDVLRDSLRFLNGRRCVPPLDDGEVDALAAWADTRVGDPGPPGGPDTLGGPERDTADRGIRPRRPRGAISLSDFISADEDVSPWSLPGLLARGGFVLCVGAPESFKTFGGFTVELAFSGAITDLLGVVPAERTPVLYVSNEKAGQMVRSRLRQMTADGRMPDEPFNVLHRRNVQFGSPTWSLVTDALGDFNRPALVLLDTVASLSPPGFDENSGRDASVVLNSIRQMQAEFGATVILNVHPSKYGQGPGGAKVRGHTSLWGEADAVWEYQRPSLSNHDGILIADVKDGERRLLPFRWNAETFLLEPRGPLHLAAATVAEMVRALWRGERVRSDVIIAAFAPAHRRTAVLDRLSEAVSTGLVATVGKGKSTGYMPADASAEADERELDHLSEDSDERRTDYRTAKRHRADGTRTEPGR
jgi:hypothetical protein